LPVRVAPRGFDARSLSVFRELPGLGGEPRISVVVPVRGGCDLVLRMAESVLERTAGLLELILIDDASPDGSLAKLEKLAGRDHRVRLLMHREQHGFAATCNEGLAAARGDLVVGLNADTVVTPGWAGRLAEHLSRKQNAGVVGPLSNRVTGLQQFAPVDYNESTLAGLTLFSDRLARSAEGQATGVVRLDSLCLAISRPALRRIGGFDPRFFPAGYEDDDFCLRLIAAGLVPYRADDTFIHHEGFRSLALEPTPHGQILEENWTRFKAKWGLPADRPRERHYSIEELPLASYARERHFIAPWKALEPVRVP
jgi:GT2 family glycosyltransferase